MGADLLLEAADLTRSFGHVKALKRASLTLREGEVRALAGANGSGKSTLIKVLSGFYVPEETAKLRVAGLEASFPMHAEDFHRLGIFCVHQDLGLIPELSVLDNVTVTDVARAGSFWVRPSLIRPHARRALDSVGLDADLDERVEDLSRSDRALLALARAYSGLGRHRHETGRCGVLILDEITAFLPKHEVQILQNVVRRVSDQGHGVIFVSHDLDEVIDSSDSVTVLRDGAVVVTAPTAEMDHRKLVRNMIGRDLQEEPGVSRQTGRSNEATARIRIKDLSGSRVRQADIDISLGEIVGVTGVLGSGFDSVPYLVFGAEKADNGSLEIGERRYDLSDQSPMRALSSGVGLIPGDRRSQGLFMDLENAENIGSLKLSEHQPRLGLLSWRKLRRGAAQSILTYEVVADGERSAPAALSGGNQQKVLLSRWLPHVDQLLLLHEPVQGVDVGAREAIIALLKDRARHGVPILCASSDYELLVRLCDRALIMRHGVIQHELTPAATDARIDKDRLVELCISDVSEVVA